MQLQYHFDAEAIQQELRGLSDELKMKAVRAGMVKVATLDVSLMKATAPVETGTLQKSVSRRQLSRTAANRLSLGADTLTMLVGPNRKVNGKYYGRLANITEGGAARHDIVPKAETRVQSLLRAQGLRGAKRMVLADGRGFFATKVDHPGTRPDPFMLRAYDQSDSQVEGLFYTGVSDYLNRLRS
jgi:hypothetical protein